MLPAYVGDPTVTVAPGGRGRRAVGEVAELVEGDVLEPAVGRAGGRELVDAAGVVPSAWIAAMVDQVVCHTEDREVSR